MSKLIVDASVLINCFQKDSDERDASRRFVDHVIQSGQLVTMPAHGWFEFLCALNRLSGPERQFLPAVFNGNMQLPLELIHIDQHFINKYGNVAIPYIKASDHIYVVIAYVNHYRLVTSDKKMCSTCRRLEVEAFTPEDYLRKHS